MELEHVLALLREVIGSRVEIERASLLKDSQDYRVWTVDLKHPEQHLVVKLGGPNAAYTCAFERTAAVHRLVREKTRLAVPEVIAADESYRKWPWRYFIKTYLTGQDWADISERVPTGALDGARAELGMHVASLHRITFDGFGEITTAGTVGSPMTCYDGLSWHAQKIIKDQAAQEFFLEALETRKELFEQGTIPSLCHEDLHKFNILLREAQQGWQIATILDFEKAWAGHRETDLARMDLWQLTGAPFWQAYQQKYLLEDGYTGRRPVYQLLWCLEFAKQTQEHLTTTQAVCRELGIAQVAQFRPAFRLM